MTDTSQSFFERVQHATDLLESVVDDRSQLAQLEEPIRRRLLTAAGRASRPTTAEQRKLIKTFRKQKRKKKAATETAQRNRAGIRQLRAQPVFSSPPPTSDAAAPPEDWEPTSFESAQLCYVCKSHFKEMHHFYDQLCPSCAGLNWEKRHARADLSGRVALVTGARLKIGYQAGLTLLRCGATLVATTRFPHDAAKRYAAEPDHAEWRDRLQIHGIDLRHTPSIEMLTQTLDQTLPRLDFIIHNACQTVRRPPQFYEHLLADEAKALPSSISSLVLHSGPGVVDSAALTQTPLLPNDALRDGALFPLGQVDADLQQVDQRDTNSWRLPLDQVSTVELLEVLLVNATAPFVMNARLKPLMMRSPERDKHIVNVSAMEGQFYRANKTDKHPHTNMAKAALNMMTRTAAQGYAEDGIHMNSVDTGWVTDEDPAQHAARKRDEHRFSPPLDIVDGAARIIDPIISGFQHGEHVWGQFLKDYAATRW